MHESLSNIQNQLVKIIAQIKTSIPSDEPFGTAHGNWAFPGLTRSELVEEAESIIEMINDHGSDDLSGDQDRIDDYVRRLQSLHSQTIAQLWGNAGQAVPAYLFTLNGLRKALEPALRRDAAAENRDKLRKLTAQVRAMEARLNGLEPRTETLGAMVARIEHAYNAADQLPTDLETLAEAQHKINVTAKDAAAQQGRINSVRENVDKIAVDLEKKRVEAVAVLKQCESAYSASTSVGLAAAFNERSNALSRSIWFWVFGLIAALGAGSFLGSGQLKNLAEMLRLPDASAAVIVLNFLLSILSVGAPIWFAWLATKQIGQRFRLAEDYAFKASISRAYEGFRKEAARFDKEMEAKLLNSALSRLDELPLRLVETATHGSPWHELASSGAVRDALRSVPEFTSQVRDLAVKSVAAVKPVKPKSNRLLKKSLARPVSA